jgi:hypothetical protein
VYDRVDWHLLGKTMRKFAFANKLIEWIMTCVSTVKNLQAGSMASYKSFRPTRGLCQGDLLLPYLFLFVANGLSSLLKHRIMYPVQTIFSVFCGFYFVAIYKT